MSFVARLITGTVLLFEADSASAQLQTKPLRVFLLENVVHNEWCSNTAEPTWKAAVQQIGAMTVGILFYSNNELTRIDLRETDESSDWIVYDNYSLNRHGQIVKLNRLINMQVGDRSVSQIFSIKNDKAIRIANIEKRLSTGASVISPPREWLPDIDIKVDPKKFPFSGLIELSAVETTSRYCMKAPLLR
jgi:hypothetical protein